MNTSLNDADFRPPSRFNPLEIAEQMDNRNEQVVSMLNSTRQGEMLQEMMTKQTVSASVQPGLATERQNLQSIPVTPEIPDQTAHAKSYGGIISESARNETAL